MARTPLFTKLRRTLQMVLWGQKNNVTDPEQLSAEFTRVEEARRRFLKLSAASLATLAFPGALAACGKKDPNPTPAVDETIAIVGGGIAGLHCAYRLKQKGIKATVYEASKRFGGRMFSARGLFADDQLCELGGELIDTNHMTLFALATELGLTLDDRFANEPANFQRDTWFIGGVNVPEATVVAQFTAVAPTMASLSAAADASDSTLAELDAIDLDTWLKTNVPITQYPELHGLLQSAYRGEFGLENNQQSSLNMLYLIGSDSPDPFRIFGTSDERYHTHLGNDSFPTMLADLLDADQKKLEHKLVAAKDLGAGEFQLDFDSPAGAVQEKVTRIVFALPFSTLRDVDLTKLTLSDLKRDIIKNIGYGTNAKVMAGFATRVWSATHNASGSLTTDMDVQQTWETSTGQTGATGILTNFLGGDQGVKCGTGTEDDWIKGVLPDLEKVWPGMTAAYTGKAVRMHWPTSPTMKGSYTCYKVGQWSTFNGQEGLREGNVHFCGEHTSIDFQGWMEGGAETGGLVAAEILDDLGTTHPQGLRDALGIKLELPQACYRGGSFGPMNAFKRRSVVRDILEKKGLL